MTSGGAGNDDAVSHLVRDRERVRKRGALTGRPIESILSFGRVLVDQQAAHHLGECASLSRACISLQNGLHSLLQLALRHQGLFTDFE
jgi:hypothetical protein